MRCAGAGAPLSLCPFPACSNYRLTVSSRSHLPPLLKQAVRRNADRFPPDFMFELVKEEFENWRSQFVTSSADQKGLRYAPMAFTEQGVAMLSSVLRSKRAIAVNVQVMRTFRGEVRL